MSWHPDVRYPYMHYPYRNAVWTVAGDPMYQQEINEAIVGLQGRSPQVNAIKMPKFVVVNEGGLVMDWCDDEKEARRKAAQRCSVDKCDYYVLKPIARCQAKDVPVETVEL